jgi:hypothetical protein
VADYLILKTTEDASPKRRYEIVQLLPTDTINKPPGI